MGALVQLVVSSVAYGERDVPIAGAKVLDAVWLCSDGLSTLVDGFGCRNGCWQKIPQSCQKEIRCWQKIPQSCQKEILQ